MQARTGQLHSRRLPVLNYLLDATLKDRLLSSASASALAAGYLDLGELDEATNVLRERIRVVTSRPAENVDELTLARHNLARVLIAKSEFNEAVDLLEQVLAARYHRTPPNVDAVRQAERDIYDCLAGLWRWDRAGAVAERRFIADQAELGDHAESTILWGARLYQACRHIDRQWDAAWGYERLIRDARATLGPMSRLAFYLRAEWAASIQELPTPDGPQRAIEAYKDLLRDRLLALGADHPETLSSRNNLANAYQSAGRLAEAIPLFERTLADCERVLGPDHPDTLTSRNNLASAYLSRAGWARRSRCMSGRWPIGSGCSARTTRTPWPRGTISPTPTRRRAGWVRRSRCSSRRWPTGSGCSARTTRTP